MSPGLQLRQPGSVQGRLYKKTAVYEEIRAYLVIRFVRSRLNSYNIYEQMLKKTGLNAVEIEKPQNTL